MKKNIIIVLVMLIVAIFMILFVKNNYKISNNKIETIPINYDESKETSIEEQKKAQEISRRTRLRGRNSNLRSSSRI